MWENAAGPGGRRDMGKRSCGWRVKGCGFSGVWVVLGGQKGSDMIIFADLQDGLAAAGQRNKIKWEGVATCQQVCWCVFNLRARL